MFLQNFLNILLISIFLGTSIAYIFSLDYIFSYFYSFLVMFFPFIFSYLYAEKIYIKPVFRVFIWGMIISLPFTLFKIPFFPVLSLSEFFYYSHGRKIFRTTISSIEIGKINFIFLLCLLLISVFGIIIKNFFLHILPSIIILSLLVPYPNSPGSILFFYNSSLLFFFTLISTIFIIIAFSLY